jgi:PII-like signaling protein
MFASKRNVRLAVTAVAIAAAAFMNSCGGKKVSATQVAASGGFETVTTPASELEELKRDLESKNMPCGIGIGESSDEMVARNVSSDEARTEVAKSVDVHVQRLSESYAQNVGNEAKKIWEEAVRQITDQHIKGAKVFKTIVQYNKESNHYKIYSLIVLDPSLFKAAITEALAKDEELEMRVKKDEMMSKLDANIAEYESKYKR